VVPVTGEDLAQVIEVRITAAQTDGVRGLIFGIAGSQKRIEKKKENQQ